MKFNFQNKNNHLLSLVWLLLLILPNNSFFYFFVPISFLLLYDYPKGEIKINIIHKISLLILGCLLFTFLVNFNQKYIVQKDYSRFLTIVIFVLTFTRLKGFKILKSYIYIAVLFLVVSQFAVFLNISFMIKFINNLYANSEEHLNQLQRISNFGMTDYGSMRLGGIFFNANQYAKHLQFVLVVLLCEFNQFKRRELIILTVLIFISVIASGSRTSLIVFASIILFFNYYQKKISFTYVFILILSSILAVSLFSEFLSSSDYRALKISEGMDNSFGTKVGLLLKYLANVTNPFNVIFGNLSTSSMGYKYFIGNNGTDFEIGDVIVNYGFAFFFLEIILLISIYKKMQSSYRVLFVILLWMFSSTIINSYRTAPIFFLTLGLYYKRSLIEQNNIYIKYDEKEIFRNN